MKKKQVFSILAGMFYALCVFQIADKGLSSLAIIYMGLGTIFTSLYAKNRKDD